MNKNVVKKNKLNPIQLKKSLRPPSQRTTINCDNTIQTQYNDVYQFLKDLNMETYLEQFVKNGINNEEKIL